MTIQQHKERLQLSLLIKYPTTQRKTAAFPLDQISNNTKKDCSFPQISFVHSSQAHKLRIFGEQIEEKILTDGSTKKMGDSDGFVVENWKNPSPNTPPAASTGANASHFSRGRSDVWQNVKPFVNGLLTGQINALQAYGLLWCAKKYILFREKAFDPRVVQVVKGFSNTIQKGIPIIFLCQAAYTTAQFGSFDLLTQKVQVANHGIPLALHQEACCGLISGGIASCISLPFGLPLASLSVGSSQSVQPKSELRRFLYRLHLKARNEGLLALWRGSGFLVTRHMFFNMGLLTSYNRTLSYFRESVGLRNTEAQIGAGIVSALVAVACSSTYTHITEIMLAISMKGGKKYSRRDLVYLVSKSFHPGGRRNFYSTMFQQFIFCAPVIVAQWWNLETVREFEETLGF